MTDLVTDLSDFEDLPTLRSAIEIPGAAGGLRDALKVQPMEARRGERVFVVLEVEVDKIRHDPTTIELDNQERPAWVRVHIMRTMGVAIVDEELVREALDAMAARIKAAKDKAQREAEAKAGIQRLPGTDPDLDACPFPGCILGDEHEGDHEVPDGADPTLIEQALKQLKKAQLKALADAHGIVHTPTTTALQLVELLAVVPDIVAEAEALGTPNNVTELRGAQDG